MTSSLPAFSEWESPLEPTMGSCGGMKGGGRREATPCLYNICSFHRLTSTLDLSVSLKAGFALADVLGGKIAALSVVHALAS